MQVIGPLVGTHSKGLQMSAKPRFGERIMIDTNEITDMLGASTQASTVAPTIAGTASGIVSTGSAASGLKTGGTALSSTGPESSAAKPVLDAMASMGSPGLAGWSAANPSLGGLAQIIVGCFLSGSSGSQAGKKAKKTPS